MMEYKVVSEETSADLENAVNVLIKSGWVPVGGVSVTVLSTSIENERKGYAENQAQWVYAQAMVMQPNE